MADFEKCIGNGISLVAARKRGIRWGVTLIPTAIFVALIVL